MYLTATGVPGDTKEALRLAKAAAAQNFPDAYFLLGMIYGSGSESDPAMATEAYRKAAELGHPRAQFNLGPRYMRRVGVQKDTAQAYFWFGNGRARQRSVDAATSS